MPNLDLSDYESKVAEWRKLYSSPNGLEVLTDIVISFGIFNYSEQPEQVTVSNHGLMMLKHLGGGDIYRDTIKEFIKRLVRQPMRKENARSHRHGS